MNWMTPASFSASSVHECGGVPVCRNILQSIHDEGACFVNPLIGKATVEWLASCIEVGT